MFNILIAEDDKNTGKLMSAFLKSEGYNPIVATDGVRALEALENNHVDLIIADIMMPNMDGYELTSILRRQNMDIPVLMVSAKYEAESKKRGFLSGTDDYMVKPVDEEELLLRIKALLRRAKIMSENKIRIGNVELDYNALTVAKEGESVLMPKKEFYLLFKLLSYPNIIFTRYQLMDEIWGMDSNTDERTVNVHINRLRDRFKDYEEFEIVTVRGLGYKAVKKV